MSFIANLEKKISEIVGEPPCKDEKTTFSYSILSAQKIGCCISVNLNLQLYGCLEDIFLKICNLNTRLDWTFTKIEDDTFQANLTLLQVEVECCNSKKENSGIITEIETNIN